MVIRHFAIGVMRKAIQSTANPFELLPIDSQAVHGRRTANTAYAREKEGPSQDITPFEEWEYKRVSQFWWKLLSLGSPAPSSATPVGRGLELRVTKGNSTTSAPPLPSPTAPLLTSSSSSAISTSSSPLPFVDFSIPEPEQPNLESFRIILQGLKSVLGEGSTFRNQEQVLAFASLLNQQDVLIQTKPGSGKTLLFQCMNFISPGSTTLVVVPLSMLLKDLSRRTGGVVFNKEKEWRPPFPPLILVHASHLLDSSLLLLINILSHAQVLASIFFDEVHLLLDPVFRSQLQATLLLRQTAQVQVPYRYLSATMPKIFKSRLMSVVGSNFAQVKGDLSFPNIKLSSVRTISRERSLESLKAYLGQQQEKAVIFVKSIEEGKKLQLDLANHGPLFYYSDLTPNAKEDLLSSFDSEIQLLIATTGFGTGVHLPNIRKIIHWGGSYGGVNLYQEANRAGRGGEYAESVMIVWHVNTEFDAAYLSPGACKRMTLMREIDQESPPCFVMSDWQNCDECSKIGDFLLIFVFSPIPSSSVP